MNMKDNNVFFSFHDKYEILKEQNSWAKQVKYRKQQEMSCKLQNYPEYLIKEYNSCANKVQEHVSETALLYILTDAKLEDHSTFDKDGIFEFLLSHSSKGTLEFIISQIFNIINVPTECKNDQWSDTSTMSTENLGESGTDIQDSFEDSSVELGKERDDELYELIESLETPQSSKVLPSLAEIVDGIHVGDSFIDKEEEFQFECNKYGLKSREDKEWYANLIRKISDVADDMAIVLELETQYHKKRVENKLLDNKNFSLHDEYRAHTIWALKLLMETLVKNKSWIPTPDK